MGRKGKKKWKQRLRRIVAEEVMGSKEAGTELQNESRREEEKQSGFKV